MRYLALLVVIALVVFALVVVGTLVWVFLVWLGRHQSRTRDQASTVHALQMALFGLVMASRQRFDAVSGNGRGDWRGGDAPWVAADAKIRPTVQRNLPLIEDVQLKQLTTELLDCTGRLFVAADPAEAARLNSEVEALHERFRARTTEVVRALAVRRVARGG